jgi:hypothetical protein
MDAYYASQRDAGALALNMLTGDVEASLDLVLSLTRSELIGAASALATDLSIALRKVHGSREEAIDHLRSHLRDLAEHH